MRSNAKWPVMGEPNAPKPLSNWMNEQS